MNSASGIGLDLIRDPERKPTKSNLQLVHPFLQYTKHIAPPNLFGL